MDWKVVRKIAWQELYATTLTFAAFVVAFPVALALLPGVILYAGTVIEWYLSGLDQTHAMAWFDAHVARFSSPIQMAQMGMLFGGAFFLIGTLFRWALRIFFRE